MSRSVQYPAGTTDELAIDAAEISLIFGYAAAAETTCLYRGSHRTHSAHDSGWSSALQTLLALCRTAPDPPLIWRRRVFDAVVTNDAIPVDARGCAVGIPAAIFRNIFLAAAMSATGAFAADVVEPVASMDLAFSWTGFRRWRRIRIAVTSSVFADPLSICLIAWRRAPTHPGPPSGREGYACEAMAPNAAARICPPCFRRLRATPCHRPEAA